MKKYVKVFAVIAAIAITVCMFGACGNKTTGDNKATTTAPAASSNELNTLESGVLKVGTNAAFPPFEYVGDDGKPDGFDMALIQAIGKKMGVTVEIQDMEFNSLVGSVGTKIDVAIAGMTVDEDRLKSVDFSDSYYTAVQYVLVPEGSAIKTADDLKGKKIGVQLGTTGDFIATDDIENSVVSRYDKGVDAVKDLVNGKIDCVIIDKNPALVFAENYKGKVAALPGSDFDFGDEFYAIAIKKGNTALTEKINAALKALKEDGTFDKLVKEYIG